jgi:mannan endo-1,4-beta-mannosidase
MTLRILAISWSLYLASFQNLFAQPGTLVDEAEAELGILTGVNKATNISGYSGTGYVTGFNAPGDKLKVIVTVPEKGMYRIVIRYFASQYKEQYVSVNTDPAAGVKFTTVTSFSDGDAGVYLFNAGNNSISISNFWGYVDVDKISVYTSVPNIYNITPDPVDANVNQATKALYDTLLSYFGEKIISGQTDYYYDMINTKAGKKPRLRAWDFQHYTEGYAYLWKNGGFSFGAEDDGSVQEAIDWYNSTNKKGIISFQWHWHSPSGGTVGTNTFYSDQTSFDVTKAVIAGTNENKLIIRDIDTIAYQLKRFQAANIPILWRPLHEAGGAWFWWGEKGSSSCKALYNILFDRMKNHHGLHNLIWVWSTPEADWYPGNSMVDIVGHDSYPGAYNYGIQKNRFDELHTLVNGEKLIALTENGPIPDPENCLTLDAPWLYFMSWGDLVTQQNSDWHLWKVFDYGKVLSFSGNSVAEPTPDPAPEPDPDLITAITDHGRKAFHIFPNPVGSGTIYLSEDNLEKVEIISSNGSILISVEYPENILDVSNLTNGVYLLKACKGRSVNFVKLIILN